ncbi:MAG: flagellar motor switch phosphatase FliY [Clostridiales bacterium]|jgi:flagellar motor switch protein FliN/FliY|nr:flagellar motor switch phosphatase FliY [Clostridiales bacterium]
MGDMLSQAEIDALLGGGSSADDDTEVNDISLSEMPDINEYVNNLEPERDFDDYLTNEQKDILGEIGNISMGTAATTLFALLHQKVWITTPVVRVTDWRSVSNSYDRPCVGIRVDYKEGLRGSNVLILKDRDVKIIADLMMGGPGEIAEPVKLSDLDMSAIGEAMNQMVGSSSTSLSSMIKLKIDIETPIPFVLDFSSNDVFDTIGFQPDDIIVRISFKMEIGNLIDSEIMQILPLEFAKGMVDQLKLEMMGGSPAETAIPQAQTYTPPQAAPSPEPPRAAPAAMPQAPMTAPPSAPPQAPPAYPAPEMQFPPGYPQGYAPPPYPQYPPQGYAPTPQYIPGYMPYPQPEPPKQEAPVNPVNVQPAQFQSFDMGSVIQQKENMGIIMDVPLEITVELGRTSKKIQEILEFAPGTIVDLDKLAGEPIDILVNGKFVAKGEVVVIDENFGIRITDIISVDKRI